MCESKNNLKKNVMNNNLHKTLTLLLLIIANNLNATNTQIRNIALENQSTIDAARVINAVASESADKAWAESSDPTGTTVWEHGFIVVRIKTVTKVGKSKVIKYEIKVKNYKKGSSGSIDIDLNVEENEEIVAVVHTHPYSEQEGGYTGVGFSALDIFSMSYNIKKNYVMLVESGNKRFFLVIENKKQVKKFFKNNSEKNIQKDYQKIFESTEGTFQEKVQTAVAGILLNSGMRCYVFDKEKQNFTEITITSPRK